jgi:predicted ATPase
MCSYRGVMGQRRSPVLVGRAEELDQLQDFVAEAFAGSAALFLVGGRVGVGKSRLVEELDSRVEASGARVAVGSCLDFGEVGLPYAPLREALRDLAGQVGVDPLPAGGEVRTVDQPHYFEQVLQTLLSAASSEPLLVVLEDLHWADTSTGDLLTFLARHVRQAPIAVVGTFRTGSASAGLRTAASRRPAPGPC